VNEPDLPLLPQVLADRYQTGRELGRGGMARVYLARDIKHGRDVAIKVLRPELSASLGHDRFLREIEIAARLRHPNIVPLYDSGEVDGSLYFVMPFEEGRSLRQRLQEHGPLPIPEALSVLRDVARALGYAHQQGVVHRDVKPDNVMLSSGAAAVTDFGIAKAVSAALVEAGAPTLTQAGSGIGTPAYMAPEQAMGDPATDHRADIYSFGCLAYEVLTGTPPFSEPTSHQMVAAHVSRLPRPVAELRPETPPAVADLVARCLAKLPEGRPQTVSDVLVVLDGTMTTGSGARPVATRATVPRLAVQGAVVVALVLLAFVGYRVTRTPVIAAPVRLSVLPLGNTSGDTAAEFLTDGLPDEIASALSRVPGVQIRSRSGARFYRGRLDVDVAEAAARLGADYIMTGVVRRASGRWMLSADVSRATDRTSIWGENFTISPDQQTVAVETITSSLLASLRNQFPKSFAGASPVVVAAGQTRNPEAYRLYLRGQERLNRRGLSVRASAEHFRQAIREDSLFARAYSGLSMAVALFPNFQGTLAAAINDEVVSAARRALALDSSLSQPHIALGLAHQFSYRWENAETEFQTAVRLDPRDVEARVQYARNLLYRLRNPSEALIQLRAARVEDPASALVLSWMSAAYMVAGQLDSALAESARAFENDSSNFSTINWRVRILLQANRGEEARRLIDRVSQLSGATAAYVYAKSGDHSGARRLLADLDALSSQPGLAQMDRAAAYLGLGDTAKALAALDRATEIGEIWTSVWPVSDPMFDPVRGSDHFAALLRRVRLPESAAAIRRRP